MFVDVFLKICTLAGGDASLIFNGCKFKVFHLLDWLLNQS